MPFYVLHRRQMNKIALRRPLAQRAKEARDALSINYCQAIDYWCKEEEFQLGSNIFFIKNEAGNVAAREIALIISHFGSIFEYSDVLIRFRKTGSREYSVFIDATPFGGEEVFHIRFAVINSQLIDLGFIRCEEGGFGGKGLIALYNFARDIGISEIMYFPQDDEARQFYFHMDFISVVSRDLFRLRI